MALLILFKPMMIKLDKNKETTYICNEISKQLIGQFSKFDFSATTDANVLKLERVFDLNSLYNKGSPFCVTQVAQATVEMVYIRMINFLFHWIK